MLKIKAFLLTVAATMAATSVFSQRTIKLEYNADNGQFEFHKTDRIVLRGKQPSLSNQYVFEASGYNYVLYKPILKVVPKRLKILVPDGLKSSVALVDFTRDSDFGVPKLESVDPKYSNGLKALDDSVPIRITLDEFITEYDKVVAVEKIIAALAKALPVMSNDPAGCENLRNQALADFAKIFSMANPDAEAIEREFAITLDKCTALKESLTLQLGCGGASDYDVNILALINSVLIASEAVKGKRDKLLESVRQFKSLFEKAQTATSPAYTHRYDYASVSIKLVSNQNPADTLLKQQLKLFSSRGLDIDFSIGLVYNSIYKRNWYVDTVGMNTIKEESGFKGDLAWTGLINLSYRTGPTNRIGISVGPGLSLIDGNMRYVLGGHWYFGERDLFGISGGICAGKRNFLPKTVSRDGDNPNETIPATMTSVTPYEKYDMGWYVGLFYNFTRQ